ncbi:MAG: hypothetical protein H5T84_10110 [Thermoleophilia bacterium]|nr:hypothetical protein [Thermoleophilia bacterium]
MKPTAPFLLCALPTTIVTDANASGGSFAMSFLVKGVQALRLAVVALGRQGGKLAEKSLRRRCRAGFDGGRLATGGRRRAGKGG